MKAAYIVLKLLKSEEFLYFLLAEMLNKYRSRQYDEHALTTGDTNSVIPRDRNSYKDLFEEMSFQTLKTVRRRQLFCLPRGAKANVGNHRSNTSP